MSNANNFVFIVALCVGYAHSVPVNNGFRYYRAPSSFNGYYRPYPMHQTMLLHYNNPYSARTAQASEITAFASGDRIGAGTYYEHGQEPAPAQEFQPPPPPSSSTNLDTDLNQQAPAESSDNGNAVSIAESYPEEDQNSDSESHQDNDVLFESGPSISYEPIPQKNNVAPTATSANPIVAQPPKINVEIETNEENDDDIVPANTKGQQPSQGSWPLHNFFPISFGSTSGGAIAIANSFSTGKGGTAASRATAYGSSSKGKLKKPLQK
ncbi:hypothetical protein HA402_014085 [Bradysia odoriphaga]|nr:hypothetical protein HA402_014085 [Bradysia odoriphaga]